MEPKPNGLSQNELGITPTEIQVVAATNRVLGIKKDIAALEGNPDLNGVPAEHITAQQRAVAELTDMLAKDPSALDAFLKRQSVLNQ